MVNIDSYACIGCNNAKFLFFKVDEELNSICADCGKVISMQDLLAENKEMGLLKKKELI